MSEQRLLVQAEIKKDIQSLFSEDYDQYQSGVESLTRYGVRAVEELIRLLKKNPLQKPREIVQALENLGPAALDPLLHALESSQDFKTLSDLFFLESLLEPLKGLKDKRQIPVLVHLLDRLNRCLENYPESGLEEPIRRIKVRIHLLLASFDSKDALDDLQALLGTGLKRIPLDILESVKKVGTKPMLPMLIRLYQQETAVSEWGAREIKEAFREICRREMIDQISDPVFHVLSSLEQEVLDKLLPKTLKKNGSGNKGEQEIIGVSQAL